MSWRGRFRKGDVVKVKATGTTLTIKNDDGPTFWPPFTVAEKDRKYFAEELELVTPAKRGIYVVVEGGNGAGKSILLTALRDFLKEQSFDLVITREPGATTVGRKIREILLNPENTSIGRLTELLLYIADRADHMETVVRPALASGAVVLSDRSYLSTKVFQGPSGRGFPDELIDRLNDVVMEDLRPDIILLLDVDAATGLSRNKEASKDDRFEQEALAFHERVREGYLAYARQNPGLIKVVDASAPPSAVYEQAKTLLCDVLAENLKQEEA